MSRVSKEVGILGPQKCNRCGEIAKRGGFWAGVVDIILCPSCLQGNALAALLADGILDSHLGVNRLAGLNHALEHFEKEFWRAACLVLLAEQREDTTKMFDLFEGKV